MKGRHPLPPEIIVRINETGRLAALAGCTPEETIDLCKRTIARWSASPSGQDWIKDAGRD